MIEKSIKTDIAKYDECDTLGESGILKFMLRAIYGSDRDGTAQALLKRFGSLGGVFAATEKELVTVEGITPRAASFFTVARSAYRQALLRSLKSSGLKSEASLSAYAAAYFMTDRSGGDYAVFADGHGAVIGTTMLTGENKPREIMGAACRCDARKAAILHYEPRTYSLIPTAESLDALHDTVYSLSRIGVGFVDYIAYGSYSFFGLRRALACGFGEFRSDGADGDEYGAFPNLCDRISEFAARQRDVPCLWRSANARSREENL